MATWADIQRLAADLQRVQLSRGVEKLSDANCVEIISKLIKSGAIDVIFTVDGKEYITKKHLLTQIRFECDGAGGRIPIVDVAANLRIDLSAAKEGVEQLLSESKEYLVSQDELIAFDYIDELCKHLDEMLFEQGHLSIFDLTQKWNVPIEFLKAYVLTELGSKVRGQRDGDSLYTSEYIEAQCNKLMAAFCATTRAASLNVYLSHMNIEQGLFFNLVKRLINENRINGTISGPKTSLAALFVPHIQEKMTQDLVRSTMSNERAISVNTMKKLNVTDHTAMLNSLFSKTETKLMHLPSVVITEDLYLGFRQTVEENMKKQCYCDVDGIFGDYSIFDKGDAQQIVRKIVKDNATSNWIYNDGDYIFANDVIKQVVDSLTGFIKDRALAEAPNIIQALKEANTTTGKKAANDEEDWNAKDKKKGGKKKPAKKEKDAAPVVSAKVFTVPREEVVAKLEELDVVPIALVDEIIDEVMVLVNQSFKTEVEDQFTAGPSGKEQKLSIQERIKEIKKIYTSFCCFEEGTGLFRGSLLDDLQQYLLKNTAHEFAVAVLSTFVSVPENQPLSAKIRNECISSIADKHVQDEITTLFESLTNVEKFHEAAQSLDACNILVKKPSKTDKDECLRLFGERQKALTNSLEDRAQLLLTIVVLVVFRQTKLPVHASGKFVLPIAKQLVGVCAEVNNSIPGEIADSILEAIHLVVRVIKGDYDEEEEEYLDRLLNKLKDYATDY